MEMGLWVKKVMPVWMEMFKCNRSVNTRRKECKVINISSALNSLVV